MPRIRVIAEPANYWHGDETLLMQMCMEAIACQADFFKLQLYNPNKLGNKWKNLAKKYEINNIRQEVLRDIVRMCENYGAEVLCTIHTSDKAKMAADEGVTNVKIASGQLDPILLNAVAEHDWDRVFVSTGMIEDVAELKAIDLLKDCTKEVVIMHTVSLYPVTDVEANLLRLKHLMELFPKDYFENPTKVSYGYSDHLMDDLCCVLSMGMGATYIEKHFKSEGCFGATCEIASDTRTFATLCSVRKRVERILGDGRIRMQDREIESKNHYKTRYMLDVSKTRH